ncbi:MAG: trigger factor [Prevotellaceae bacterium]|jgi:trigger factor|nr:trigger factor [Prevotellaceae bacterium]
MNIQQTNTDAVNAVLSLQIEKADYQERVEKTLRGYRQKANIPGFRAGMVPMGLVRKMYGKAVLAEEINKLVSEQLYSYIKDNNLNILGEPLPSEEQKEINFDGQENFDFVFDIAIAPEMSVELSKKDKVKFYEIEVDDKMIENQIKSYTSRFGSYIPAEGGAEANDILRGNAVEMGADGNQKDGGIKAENAMITPAYVQDEAQKALFIGAKEGDVITFNPQAAFRNETEMSSMLKISKEEAQATTSDFQFTITAITRYKEAELDQTLFDKVFGEGKVTSEEAFRNKIIDGLKETLNADSTYKFGLDAKETILKKLEKVALPEAFLKRWLLATNENMTQEKIDADFSKMAEGLKIDLFMDKFAKDNNLKIEQEDITAQAKKVAAAQFAQYGMLSVPDDVLDNYAQDMLKKQDTARNLAMRAMEEKTFAVIKEQVTLDVKKVSIDEFNKLFEAK